MTSATPASTGLRRAGRVLIRTVRILGGSLLALVGWGLLDRAYGSTRIDGMHADLALLAQAVAFGLFGLLFVIWAAQSAFGAGPRRSETDG